MPKNISPIEVKYQKNRWLGKPTSAERSTPDGVGRYRHYKNGSIYWHPKTGAHEVHGSIRRKWQQLGWERSILGYPKTDETKTPDGAGRYNHFQGGSIYWHPKTGAHEVHGSIRRKWQQLGWERGFLGYPKTDETKTPDGVGRYNHFQGGSIYWHPKTGAHEVHGSIRRKWQRLGWERSFLGYPVTDETKTPDGAGRYNHFQGGSIYWHPKTGAHEVHGDIRVHWAQLGWEKGALGYPKRDERAATGGGRISSFEHGYIRWQVIDVPNLSFFQQNMALLPPPGSYKGTERNKAIDSLVRYLQESQPDVVGLSEVFVDGERDRIKAALRSLYPYSLEGPDEKDLESDGGLLLLSRHRIVARHQTIYRQCLGDDCLANKGALHAQIRVAGHPTRYNFFLTHLQAGNPKADVPNIGPGSSGWDKIKSQLSHLGSFIRACTNSFEYPTLLMGDLNTNGLNPDKYQELQRRLHGPGDLWLATGDGSRGVTGGAPDNNFTGKADSGSKGSRIDYFLSWDGRRYKPNYRRTRVMKLESSPGRHLSDHYGLRTELVALRELRVNIRRPVKRVQVSLLGFHCLEETDEVGSDEVYFYLACRAASGATVQARTGVKEDVDKGEYHTYRRPKTVSLNDPGRWLQVYVSGREEDDWPNRDDNMGTRRLTLSLADLRQTIGRPETRLMPLLTGDGGEYAVMVRVEAA